MSESAVHGPAPGMGAVVDESTAPQAAPQGTAAYGPPQAVPYPAPIPLARDLATLRPLVAGLGFAVAFRAELGAAPPPAQEQAACAGFGPERREEFLLGRLALRRALGDAGIPTAAVPAAGRLPRLPAHSTASLSHSGPVAVALAGAADRFGALGVDLELDGLPLSAGRLILSPHEQEWVTRGAEQAGWRLLAAFSAKEAAFKALDPLLGGGSPPLPGLRLEPEDGGFQIWPGTHPGLRLRVSVQPVGTGVFSWTCLHTRRPRH